MYMTNKLKLLDSFILAVLAFSVPQKAWGADHTYDLVERVYSGNVTYRNGAFNYHEDRNANFLRTLPREQNDPHSQCVLAYNQRPENYFGREETILGFVRPPDGRDRIQNTNEWPHRIHAQLTMTRGQEVWGGSGVLVGPHHLLTCAHNVYNRLGEQGNYFEGISVYPALNDNISPFNSARVVKAYVFREWVDRGDPRFDMALLLLDQSIGNFTGWGGLLSTTPAELLQEEVSITGYPGDKGLRQMWTMNHRIQTVMDEEFDYIIDTYPGQSGSAVWTNRLAMPMVLGVHTLGDNLRNSGVRLSVEKFKKLFEIIAGTYTLNDVNDSGLENPLSLRHAIPLLAQGYEEIYQRFLRGVLIYRPQPGTDVGRINLPIAKLANPLEGTFDLSYCGDSGMHLSISTGYRKRKKAENSGKVEIWITPRFLIEKEIATTASHFKPIINYWKQNAPVGLFWTWGGEDDLTRYDYIIDQSMDEISNNNLYEKWLPSYATSPNSRNFRNIIGYHNEEAGTYGSPHSKGAYFVCELNY